MLTEGTEKLDKIAYSEALADVASNIIAYAGDDSQGAPAREPDASTSTRRSRCSSTRCARRACAQSDFDRMIKRRIEAVKQSRGQPELDPRPRHRAPVLYGATHPFGAVVTEESLTAITLDDCKKYVATWLKPKQRAAVRRR